MTTPTAIRKMNNTDGPLVADLLQQHKLSVSVAEKPQRHPSMKGKTLELVRLCVINIIVACIIFKLYSMKVNMSENDIYVMIDIIRYRYSMLFSVVVESKILTAGQFIRASQLAIPFMFTFILQLIKTGSAGKLSVGMAALPSLSLFLMDRHMGFTSKIINSSLNQYADTKHRMFDFMLSVVPGIRMTSTAEILLEQSKTLLAASLGMLMFFQAKYSIEFFDKGYNLISMKAIKGKRANLSVSARMMLNSK